jgi:acyl carrier protein
MDERELFCIVAARISKFTKTDLSCLELEVTVTPASLGLDSLKLYEVILDLEDHLDVELGQTVADHVDTLQEFVAYIYSVLRSKSPITEQGSVGTGEAK